jgi:glucosamine-6-phosphate deaminase
MEVVIDCDSATASKRAANLIAQSIRRKKDTVLGLATGSTPLQLYAELIRMHQEEGLCFREVRTFNLDEYIGLHPGHECSYRKFMCDNLFDHVNIDPANVHVPDGLTGDVRGHCVDYERAIAAAGGIDIQVLGIGSDGHIGFNEPTSSFASRTRIKTITPQTTEDNARFFDDDIDQVPRHCITMGIGTILESRQIVLLAFGEGKAEAVRQSVEGPIAAIMPASILQMHQTVKFLLDEPAASLLEHRQYYDWVFENKPDWQEF